MTSNRPSTGIPAPGGVDVVDEAKLFFLGMLRHDYGVLLNTSLPMPNRPIAVQFRSAYTPTATVVLDDGRVRLAPPEDPYDVRVTFHPARFNLMLFGRTRTITAAIRRHVVVGGPRPWRLPAFLRVVHMPNPGIADVDPRHSFPVSLEPHQGMSLLIPSPSTPHARGRGGHDPRVALRRHGDGVPDAQPTGWGHGRASSVSCACSTAWRSSWTGRLRRPRRRHRRRR